MEKWKGVVNQGGELPIEGRPAPDYRSAWFLPEQIVKSFEDGRAALVESSFKSLLPIPTYEAFFSDPKHHNAREQEVALHQTDPAIIKQINDLVYQFNAELLDIKIGKKLGRLSWYCKQIEKLIPKAPQRSPHLKPQK